MPGASGANVRSVCEVLRAEWKCTGGSGSHPLSSTRGRTTVLARLKAGGMGKRSRGTRWSLPVWHAEPRNEVELARVARGEAHGQTSLPMAPSIEDACSTATTVMHRAPCYGAVLQRVKVPAREVGLFHPVAVGTAEEAEGDQGGSPNA